MSRHNDNHHDIFDILKDLALIYIIYSFIFGSEEKEMSDSMRIFLIVIGLVFASFVILAIMTVAIIT